MKFRHVGEAIYSHRKRAALSQESLAQLAKVSVQTVRNIEHGVTEANARSIKNISAALKVTPQELFDSVGDSDALVMPGSNMSILEHSNIWPRRLIICSNIELCCYAAARRLINVIIESPGQSVVLPTGKTAKTLFSVLLKSISDEEKEKFKSMHFFIDTETFGVESTHQASRSAFVRRQFIDKLAEIGCYIPNEHVHFFEGIIRGDRAPFYDYNEALKNHPIRLSIMALSPTGEVSGYSAGVYTADDDIMHDGCRVITLTEPDRRYIDSSQPSRSIITIGYGNILSSYEIIVLAYHPHKSNAIKMLVSGECSPERPSTILRHHNNSFLIISEDACVKAMLENNNVISRANEAEEFVGEM